MTRVPFSLCCPVCSVIAAVPDNGSQLGIRRNDGAGSITVQEGTGAIFLLCPYCRNTSVLGYYEGDMTPPLPKASCGAVVGGFDYVCRLPEGHEGNHRGDGGSEWR